MTDVATIKGFNVAFTLNQVGIKTPTQLAAMLNFDSVTCVESKQGIYTPNNDYEWLWQSIPAAEAPNFVFLQTPTLANISVRLASGLLIANAVPANKLFLLTLPPGTLVDNIYLEGRPGQGSSMAQGVPSQYYCLMAQANF